MSAIADAGLEPDDIDGVSTWPGATEPTPGFSGVGVFEVKDALGLDLRWFAGGSETAGQLGAIINACAAVRAGMVNHVLCFRTVWEATSQQISSTKPSVFDSRSRTSSWSQWLTPFGAVSASTWAAMMATRHFHEYGTTKEQLGALAVNQRANAALNPHAVYRDPISLDDYLAARQIATPLGLLDCDVPVDGSTAIIVSRESSAPGGVVIESIGSAMNRRPLWDQYADMTDLLAFDVGADLWRGTELRPADVDVAQLYDGFTILTLIWLEALGLCPVGQSGAFVDGGTNIALDGLLPLNTGGGQLSAGRLHGFGHLHEAVVQLRGTGGQRQVRGNPEVAIVAAGGGHLGGALLLSRP
jgi:acetyl-CoA acetyltransferase